MIKVASLFAGIGGIDLGFENAGAKSIWANEIDKNSAMTFSANHKDTELIVEDINKVSSSIIPDVDIIVGGFPCQPFSVAGYRMGFEDDRGNLFLQIIRILEEMKQQNRLPKVVFLENVKNLYNHNEGKTYKCIKSELQRIGYIVQEKILNSCEYGNIPQNRERLYIICFLDLKCANEFNWISKIKRTVLLENIISWNVKVPEKYYYKSTNLNYSLLDQNIKYTHSIYQFRRIYVRENKSQVCPTLTANMGTGGHNVPLIRDDMGDIRKLTPRECLLLQGFSNYFVIPESLSDSYIYKQAGNSVTVTVIERLAREIMRAIYEVYKLQ